MAQAYSSGMDTTLKNDNEEIYSLRKLMIIHGMKMLIFMADTCNNTRHFMSLNVTFLCAREMIKDISTSR